MGDERGEVTCGGRWQAGRRLPVERPRIGRLARAGSSSQVNRSIAEELNHEVPTRSGNRLLAPNFKTQHVR
jgi:hypothetical protein